MNSSEIHRLRVLHEGTICHICEKNAPVPGNDEFGGRTCADCRAELARARERLARQGGYAERAPQGDVK